ncbi:MFS transporter [Microbacterium gorillae]|uniref:MFS transporter n=1 Tax=Microbacterium gorillae TaxID=1231063 RepID=UPI00058B19B5|nr:MFS transporter [Microbacterium gorillae]
MTVITSHRPESLRRSVSNTIKGSAGNLVEWYDVYVYSTFAAAFETKFFAADDSNSQIYIWAIFAVTFLMRPVGSWLFGRFADRRGRRASLSVSVSIMAACSLVIAVTPTRETIGVWAAVILVLCRLVQGLATGGEYGTSATYMSEAAVKSHRGFLSSFQYVTLVGGQVLAQAVWLIMLTGWGSDAIAEWGWRVAFGIGAVGALVVLWLRRTMDESLTAESLTDIRAGKVRRSGSMRELLGNYWRELLAVFLVTMGGTVAFYTYTVNAPTILKTTFAGKNAVLGGVITLVALIILMLLQPLGGWISDRIGRKPVLIFFGVGGVLFSWVLILVLPTVTNALGAFAILLVGFVIITGYTSINAIVKASMLPTHIRALGVGFGYAMANSIFGGTAPLLYAAANKGGVVPLFAIYVTAAILISLIVYIVLLRNHGPNWLDDEEQMHARKEGPEHRTFPIGV